VAGVLRSRAETTATTFSRPRRSDLDMRRRHPDLSAWWRRCFGQRQPLYTGFSCPDSDLSERHQESQLPSRPQALCAFTGGNVPISIQRLRESIILGDIIARLRRAAALEGAVPWTKWARVRRVRRVRTPPEPSHRRHITRARLL
jgi:hypothetical protein